MLTGKYVWLMTCAQGCRFHDQKPVIRDSPGAVRRLMQRRTQGSLKVGNRYQWKL